MASSLWLKRVHLLRNRKEKGFTLLELTVVLAIILILGISGLVAIRSFIVGGRIDPAANELRRAMQRMSINAEGQGATAYSTSSTSQFCNLMREGSIFTVTGVGAAATCAHNLTNFGTQAVTVAPAAQATAGDSYTVTMSNVSQFACPDLMSVMQKATLTMSVNGTVVKAVGSNYNASAATAACSTGDVNTFTFTAS